jgi:pyroglutamyl-peptidase
MLPLPAILAALTAEGSPAYVASSAGTFLCNQTMDLTLHALRHRLHPPPVGLVHLPLLPSMVVAAGTDEPSMDFALMLRAVETTLDVLAAPPTQ